RSAPADRSTAEPLGLQPATGHRKNRRQPTLNIGESKRAHGRFQKVPLPTAVRRTAAAFESDAKVKDLSMFRHFVVALLALCAGCVGIEKSYPDKRYFVLEVSANPSPANPTGNDTLEVSNIRVSPRYADRSFVYRTSESGYESDFYNQFLVSPASLITEEVRKGL